MISSTSLTKGYYFLPKPNVDVSVVYVVLKGNEKRGAPHILMHFHKILVRQFSNGEEGGNCSS